MNPSSPQQLVDHLFRHEAGRMIAVLTRIFGMHNMALAEDVVQEAFLKAVQIWKFDTLPQNPAAWLMQVARNKAIDIIRRQHHFNAYSAEITTRFQTEAEQTIQQFFSEREIEDSQLQMIFACCHPVLKEEDQVALTLRTISGFNTAEIARALFTTEATIQKRLYRARQYIKEHNLQMDIPAGQELMSRLDIVYTVIYLLFNEGYNSQKADELIRRDLCAEAMRLCLLLTEHTVLNRPASFGLLALMCFQASRFDSRMDQNHTIITLGNQDRSKWNEALINQGYYYLNKSSEGPILSVYHLEAAIAAEHCKARSFASTDWQHILTLYDLLLLKKPSAVVQLNRSVILMQLHLLKEAELAILAIPEIDQLFQTQYIYAAVLGDVYLKMNMPDLAKQYLNLALQLTGSKAEQQLISGKIAAAESAQNFN